MKNKIVVLILMVLAIVLVASCADVEPNVAKCITGHTYGFWGGLWHGMILPFSCIGSLFSDDIAVWAVNNNGNWYTFGFFLGIGGLGFGTSSSRRK